jgi:serine/threonine protein phosphatase PrpC
MQGCCRGNGRNENGPESWEGEFVRLVSQELEQSRQQNPSPLHSPHEALAWIQQALSHLRNQVYREPQHRSVMATLAALVRLAMLAQRSAEDLNVMAMAKRQSAGKF